MKSHRMLLGVGLFLVVSAGVSCDIPAEAHVIQAPTPSIVVQVRTVRRADRSGLATVLCPQHSKLVGGGCDCSSSLQTMFISAPIPDADGFACGCVTPPPFAQLDAVVFALCMDAGAQYANIEVRDLQEREQLRDAAQRRLSDSLHSRVPAESGRAPSEAP